jgi:hypothetical protein
MKGIIFSPSLFTIVTVGIASIIGKIILKLRSDNMSKKCMEVDWIKQVGIASIIGKIILRSDNMSMKCMEVDWIKQTDDRKQCQNFIITVIKNEKYT